MTSKTIITRGTFVPEKFIFKTFSNIPFEELYYKKKQDIEKDQLNNNELIDTDGYKYLFNNPHKIKFTFHDGKKQDIFLANISQFIWLNEQFGKENTREISKDGIKYYPSIDVSESFSSNYIRYINSTIDENEYNKARNFKKYTEELSLDDLSLNYGFYLENSENINQKENYFVKTDERSNFFQFLEMHLSHNRKLALCGLEGIGKTASILAYLKCYKLLYFYFNVKTIDRLLKQNEKQKIIKILLREMYHFIEDFKEAESYYNEIKKIIENNYLVMDILTAIIQYIEFKVEIIVIDQYKTKYDDDYLKLINIIDNNKNNKIIVISSMNEDDIRKSIIISIRYALHLSTEKPKLEYYYIIKLVEVSENDKKNLSTHKRELLTEFGNLYIYYHKIMKKKSGNPKKNFKKEIKDELIDKINEYFVNKNANEMVKIYEFLIMKENEEMELKACFENINYIPLRYFSLNYKDKNIINFKDLDTNCKIYFKSSFDFIKEFFLYSLKNIMINNKNNYITENTDVNQESINLEKFFGYFLWGFRGNIKINGTNIVSYQKVNSIFEINNECISSLKEQLKNLKQNNSILILQKFQNAKFFDVGILEKKNGYYNLYLIQVTEKKESKERLTITGLNDIINYINGFFSKKLEIQINNNYFCYVFDYNNPDNATINYCKQNGIDHLLFDMENLCLKENLSLKPLYYYLPTCKYSEETPKLERMVTIPKLTFSDINDQTEENLKTAKQFLQKKREIMSNDKDDEKEIDELEQLYEYEKKLNKGKKTSKNYERREFIINNYLLSKEFKNRKIYGISYKKCENIDLHFTGIQEKNLFELCGKKIEQHIIFKIDKINVPQLNNFKPEFECFIIYCTKENTKYYFDFINDNLFDLDDKSLYNYKGKNLIVFGAFYSIMFLDKNIDIS